MRRSITIGLCVAIVLGAVALGQKDSTPKAEPASKELSKAPKFWKGNLHTHTLWSDGDDYPEMVADWYKSHGYDFLSLTDHNVLSDAERWVDVTPKVEKGLQKYVDRFDPYSYLNFILFFPLQFKFSNMFFVKPKMMPNFVPDHPANQGRDMLGSLGKLFYSPFPYCYLVRQRWT